MSALACPKCEIEKKPRSIIRRDGVYYRTSDSQVVQRYRCVSCRKAFSQATYQSCYRQKKRHKNEDLRKHFSSLGSQRRAARNFHLARVTVARKFYFLSLKAEYLLHKENQEKPKASEIEFDDLETFEHTKCKPLSVTVAVETKTRRILGLEVSVMPAKGLLVEKAKKYGYRKDERRCGRRRLFRKLQPLVEEDVLIKSDSNPHYPKDVKELFPHAKHITYMGRKGASTGQGELKRVKFDPLFSLNHTCAMMRANVNRLIRKTWCTTKSADNLYAHLMIYAQFHNERLI
jgi:transposase-like protein